MAKKIKIYTDGGARGNPGPSGIGVVVQDEHGLVIGRHKKFIGNATNNVAEYKALLLGILEAKKIGADEVLIYMDSELVVKQMKREYKIKEPTLQILAKEAFSYLKDFSLVKFNHIRREFNKEADALVNEAIDEA